MTRNTKIAIGCGGAGCLGIIVIVIVAGVIYYLNQSSYNRNYNFNSNSNNSNYNTNDNSNLNSNTDDSSSSMSDDDKHKLFQAAGITKDNELILRVIKKLGFGDGTGSDYADFLREHPDWAVKNYDFIRSVLDPEKAREYVDAHIDD